MKINKLLKKELSWKILIIFSIIIGIIVGVINRIPIFNNTSFQDIAIYYDMWIVLAVFIILNCKNTKNAVLKCFIFFLISQPLIYFSEAIMDTAFFNKNFLFSLDLYFRVYYFGYGWFTRTLLTIPGAFVAYQVKKDNILSSLILSVATGFLSYRGISIIIKSFSNFPYHLLNGLLCLFFAYFLILYFLKNKKGKMISLIITSVFILVAIIIGSISLNKVPYSSDVIDFPDGIVADNFIISNEKIAFVSLSDDGTYMVVNSQSSNGEAKIELYYLDKLICTYNVNVDKNGLKIQIEE